MMWKKYVLVRIYILTLSALGLLFLFAEKYLYMWLMFILVIIFIVIKGLIFKYMFPDEIEEEEEEEEEDEDIDEFKDEDIDEEDIDDIDTTDFNEDNLANNALQYASIVSTPSESAKIHKHLPKEIRYSFLEKDEVQDVKHKSNMYHLYKYMKKVLELQKKEDEYILHNRLKLYQVTDTDTFKEYCEENNLLSVYNILKQDDFKMQHLISYIKSLQQNGFYEDMINQNNSITDFYEEYRDLNSIPQYVDDLGLSSSIITTGVVSMGRAGNERQAQITTISATRDLDMKKEQEEKTEYKNKIAGFINKFRE